MGADGGSIPDRRDLVKTKPKAQQKDVNNLRLAKYSQCALSGLPLQQPIVLDPLGKLLNKDALVEFLLDRTSFGDGEQICGYVRSLKDVRTLNLTPNPSLDIVTFSNVPDDLAPPKAFFACPLTLKEMNGSLPFVALAPCGCVFSQAALKALVTTSSAVASSTSIPSPPATSDEESKKAAGAPVDKTVPCPLCSVPFPPSKDGTFLPINPPEDAQHDALIALNEARALKSGRSKKRKSGVAGGDDDEASSKKRKAKDATAAEGIDKLVKTAKVAGSRAVHAELAAAEEKRKKDGMSAAVKSLYAPKGGKEDDNYMTRGTFTRYA